MSDYIELYVIDESVFPISLTGTDEEKYGELVKYVKTKGSRWEYLEINRLIYMKGLEAVGALIGDVKLLAVLSYNNSPYNLLGNYPKISGAFGYFTPDMVGDICAALEEVRPQVESSSTSYREVLQRHEDVSQDVFEYIFYHYLSAFKEAADRGYAIAVLHNEVD